MITKPRVLQIVDSVAACSPTWQAVALAKQLTGEGWPNRLVHLNLGSSSKSCVPAEGLTLRDQLDFSGLSELWRTTRRFRPTVVHLWGTQSPRLAWLVRRVAPASRILVSPVVRDPQRALGNRWLARLALSGCDACLVPSNLVIETLPERWKQRSIAVGWGWEPPGPSSAPDEQFRALNLPPHARLVGTVAKLEPSMRVKDLIWAADLVNCIRDDVYWLVIGEGPQRKRLERYAVQVGVESHIRFVDQFELSAELVPMLSAYVQLGSTYFDFNGMMMAMSCGVPIIGARCPIVQKFVRSGYSGYLVERGARNEIARCVHRLANRSDLAQQFGSQGKRVIHEQFPLTRFRDRVFDLYRQAGERPGWTGGSQSARVG